MRVLTLMSILFVLGACEAKLKLIQTIFRHGDRAPVKGGEKYYPNDPYLNETWYPVGFGGLNNRGKQRAFQLGKFFKQRYGKLLGDVYTPDVVTFYSSELERARMTALVVAAGLFPPNKDQKWNKFLNWQPIPVWSVNNSILFSGTKCSEWINMREEDERRRKVSLERILGEFLQRLSMYAGTNVTQRGVYDIYDQVEAEESSGKPAPDWIYQFGYPDGQINNIAGFELYLQSYSTAIQKYTGGQWISEWLYNVDYHLNGMLGDKKGIFYGGHQNNIGAILTTLEVFRSHMPKFCSSVIFELHELKGDYFVKVVYKNGHVVEELTIPNCGDVYCPLEKFISIFADVLPDDHLPCTLSTAGTK